MFRDAASGLSYQVMRDGGHTLDELVGRWGPLPARGVVRVARRVLVALTVCHAHGLLYSDAHPGNLVVPVPSRATASGSSLEGGEHRHPLAPASGWGAEAADLGACCIVDWGSTRRARKQPAAGGPVAVVPVMSVPAVTGEAALAYGALTPPHPSPSTWVYAGPTRGGRWDFMPPEQFGEGRFASGAVTLTPAADVFALGATLAFLLCGAAPFGVPPGAKLMVDACLRAHPHRQDPAALEAWLHRGAAATCDCSGHAAGGRGSAGQGRVSDSATQDVSSSCASCAALVALLVRAMQPRVSDRFADAAAMLEGLGSAGP